MIPKTEWEPFHNKNVHKLIHPLVFQEYCKLKIIAKQLCTSIKFNLVLYKDHY